MRASLRLKLTFWFVLVFFLIQSCLIGGILYYQREQIQRAADDDLTAAAEATVDNILMAKVEWTAEAVQPLIPDGVQFVFYAIRDESGEPLFAWNLADGRELPFSAWEVVPAGPIGGVQTGLAPERASELGFPAARLRLITLPFRYSEELYYFQAAVPDRGFDRLVGPFSDLVTIGVPVGVLAAFVAAWFIGGRAVSPIRMLSTAARGVSPTNLSERLRVSTTDSEVARLERELNSALERLESGYEAQAQFIANVSHELRTPIAALLVQAQVARLGQPSSDKAYAFVDLAERRLKRLGKLVESFLVLARAENTGRLPREPVAVLDVVLDCVQSCRSDAEQAGVRLVPNLYADSGEAELHGDPELLKTMLENLVRNAVAYAPAKSEIAITAEREGHAVRFRVSDEGPGIPADFLPQVFDRYARAQGAARRDGMGLGLAITAGIARLHGGSVAAENNAGRGCTFEVRIPIVAASG